LKFTAPFATERFTVRVKEVQAGPPRLTVGGRILQLEKVGSISRLTGNTWVEEDEGTVVCFDLPKGVSTLKV
jgi:hypothetical protein